MNDKLAFALGCISSVTIFDVVVFLLAEAGHASNPMLMISMANIVISIVFVGLAAINVHKTARLLHDMRQHYKMLSISTDEQEVYEDAQFQQISTSPRKIDVQHQSKRN